MRFSLLVTFSSFRFVFQSSFRLRTSILTPCVHADQIHVHDEPSN